MLLRPMPTVFILEALIKQPYKWVWSVVNGTIVVWKCTAVLCVVTAYTMLFGRESGCSPIAPGTDWGPIP